MSTFEKASYLNHFMFNAVKILAAAKKSTFSLLDC